MSFIKTGASAIGKLLIVIVLAATFMAGLVGTVYLSLRGEEVKVPEVVGKDFFQSEKEVEDLGLKLKRRATRYSQEKPNTVLEQLPKPGETVKTGQTILVVLSEANPEGSEAPATIQKPTSATEAEEESTDITPEKPVKTNKNANVKKPAQTTRDVISNKNSNSNLANVNSGNSNSNSKSNSNDTNKNSGNKNSSTTPVNKPTPAVNNNSTKPATPAKTPNGGDMRTRKVP